MHHPELQRASREPAKCEQKEVGRPDSGGSSDEEHDDARRTVVTFFGRQQDVRDEEATQNEEESNADMAEVRVLSPEMRIKHRQQRDCSQSI